MTKVAITAPETPAARIQAAKARFDAAQAEVDRVLAARTAPPDVSATAAALDAARLDFEDASGARALGTATEAELREAADALTKARQAREAAVAAAEQADMTRAGFERALVQAQAEVDAAVAVRREAELEWLRGELFAADQAYCLAGEAMLAAWRRAKSAARAIKFRSGRANNCTELAQLPVIPALCAWRDPQTHSIAASQGTAVDWHSTERALQAAWPSSVEG